MSNLEIPERAWRAFGAEAHIGNDLEAAAPIIVAAYIRNVLMPAAATLMDGTDAWLDLHARDLDPEGTAS